jgi:hypothetical protein
MTFTFLRSDVSFGCGAQLSTKRMFLFWTPILASNERRNEEKMSVVIHALLFAWYLVGYFFYILQTSRFRRFSDNNRQFSHSGIWFNMQQVIQAALRKQYTRAQRTKSLFQILNKLSMWENVASGPWFFNDEHDKTTVRGPTAAGKNCVIYMGLVPGPNKADNICGKTIVTGTRFHCIYDIKYEYKQHMYSKW